MSEIYKEVVKGYLDDALVTFRAYKKLAERALEQMGDEDFFSPAGEESNSAAIIVKHIAGNSMSRWRDFLTEDGEKADRDRDSEFEIDNADRAGLMRRWQAGWAVLFESLESLSPVDAAKRVTIRGEPHTVVQAINRQLTHYAYHIGQIVLLAKASKGGEWKSLSVPKNRSKEFNEYLLRKASEGKEASHPLEGSAEFTSSSEKDD